MLHVLHSSWSKAFPTCAPPEGPVGPLRPSQSRQLYCPSTGTQLDTPKKPYWSQLRLPVTVESGKVLSMRLPALVLAPYGLGVSAYFIKYWHLWESGHPFSIPGGILNSSNNILKYQCLEDLVIYLPYSLAVCTDRKCAWPRMMKRLLVWKYHYYYTIHSLSHFLFGNGCLFIFHCIFQAVQILIRKWLTLIRQ